MMYAVIGSSGRWELNDKWVVAVFRDERTADRWCRRCSEYGQWIGEMQQAAYEEQRCYERKLWLNPKHDEALLDDSNKVQFVWAIEGSLEQEELWQQAFEAKYPTSEDHQYANNFWQYRAREISLMLNPYDPKIYQSSWYDLASISYRVEPVLSDPPDPLVR